MEEFITNLIKNFEVVAEAVDATAYAEQLVIV